MLALARAVADGRITLDAGADRDETERRLLELPGIGPWTAAYVRMRALGDPDVFPPGDLALERAINRVDAGATGDTRWGRPHLATEAWKPWRSNAVAHLWADAHSPGSGAPHSPTRSAASGAPHSPTRPRKAR